MTEQEFRVAYPVIFGWIQNTLAQHGSVTRPVASLGFQRLPLYYNGEALTAAKVAVVPVVPVPPLAEMGLDRFRDFADLTPAGITYLDTYFVRADHVADESVHFHELVHVVQWRLLGPERFLADYAAGLGRFGYRKSPLEVMAYDLQNRFETGSPSFDVEQVVARALVPK